MPGDLSLVTEYFLANNFTPKSGITPGSDNTLIMSCTQILARYRVTISGSTTNSDRCPSEDELVMVSSGGTVGLSYNTTPSTIFGPGIAEYTGTLTYYKTVLAEIFSDTIGFNFTIPTGTIPAGQTEVRTLQLSIYNEAGTTLLYASGVCSAGSLPTFYHNLTKTSGYEALIIHIRIVNDHWDTTRPSSTYHLNIIPGAILTDYGPTFDATLLGVMTTIVVLNEPRTSSSDNAYDINDRAGNIDISGYSGEIFSGKIQRQSGPTYNWANGYRDFTIRESFTTGGFSSLKKFQRLIATLSGMYYVDGDFTAYDGNFTDMECQHSLLDTAGTYYSSWYKMNNSYGSTVAFGYQINALKYCQIAYSVSRNILSLTNTEHKAYFSDIVTANRGLPREVYATIMFVPGSTLGSSESYTVRITATGTTVNIRRFDGLMLFTTIGTAQSSMYYDITLYPDSDYYNDTDLAVDGGNTFLIQFYDSAATVTLSAISNCNVNISPYSYKTISNTAPNTPPDINTTAITSIAKRTATSGGSVNDNGGATITTVGVCWNTTGNPVVSDAHTSDSVGTSWTSYLTGLLPGIRYYVRSYAGNSAGTGYGSEVNFLTLADIAVLTTDSATSLTQSTAVCGGNVTADSGSTVTERGLCWSTTSNPPTTADTKQTFSGTTGTFSGTISGLSTGTFYRIRAYAINGQGTAYGNLVTFTTSAGVVPTLDQTYAATSIDGSNASTGGNMTWNGGLTILEHGVCWSTTTGPIATGSHLTATAYPWISFITGLANNTKYYVRSYATNSVGTGYGPEINFTTLHAPILSNNVGTWTNNTYLVCGGTISDDGGATVYERGICWNTSPGVTVGNSTVQSGSGTGAFTANTTGLTTNTTYYYNTYAINNVGLIGYGTERSILSPSGPTVPSTTAATSIGQTTATTGTRSAVRTRRSSYTDVTRPPVPTTTSTRPSWAASSRRPRCSSSPRQPRSSSRSRTTRVASAT